MNVPSSDLAKELPAAGTSKTPFRMVKQMLGRAAAKWRDRETFELAMKSIRKYHAIQKPIEFFSALTHVKAVQPQTFMEIGTHRGGSLYGWMHVIDENAFVLSADLHKDGWSEQIGEQDLLDSISAMRQPNQTLELVRGDSHTQETLDDVRRRLDGRQIDVLFIDGDHRYEGVRSDYEMYSPLVRDGGQIGFHDIVINPDLPHYGVSKFWSEIKQGRDYVEFVDRSYWMRGCGIGFVEHRQR